jgi:hypothetical protein
MSPDEFRLVLRSMDHAGHLLVEFTIVKTALIGDKPETVAMRLHGAFELDPGTLPEIVEAFTTLASDAST